MSGDEEAGNLDTAATGMRALADALDAGRGPRRGRGVRRAAGSTVVPGGVHDALCGWRDATPQPDTTPPIMGCAGCGLAYPVEDAGTLRDPQARRVPNSGTDPRVSAVLELHVPDLEDDCKECRDFAGNAKAWPCPTARAAGVSGAERGGSR